MNSIQQQIQDELIKLHTIKILDTSILSRKNFFGVNVNHDNIKRNVGDK